MTVIQQLLNASSVHDEWEEPLTNALKVVDESYLKSLITDPTWLPGQNNLFAAFQRDFKNCEYILFGESPYPRQESANGIAFFDAAVTDLWSEKGLSKKVNRATSLRNIMKTALLAQGLIKPESDGKIPQSSIAKIDKNKLIQNIHELFDSLNHKGFLLFNATPVLHPERKPVAEARFWTGFVNQLLQEIVQQKDNLPTLVLWGKIAQQIEAMPVTASYPKICSEHPYNISFIQNENMLNLFRQLNILQKNE